MLQSRRSASLSIRNAPLRVPTSSNVRDIRSPPPSRDESTLRLLVPVKLIGRAGRRVGSGSVGKTPACAALALAVLLGLVEWGYPTGAAGRAPETNRTLHTLP